ncbi:hypothetical protein [Olleya marilimosa]|uniref:hypothetical protein n=1 Tax=Olleya marilimosa TaxID=272164 RepID=UPI0004846B48|nr:hypothetical protein [Olleya marilimosa]
MFKLGITFEACFPDEERGELGEYLSGINKADLLKMGSFFLGFNVEKSRYSNIPHFLQMFFGPENSDFAQAIYTNILRYIETTEYPLEIYEVPYVVSSLKLFEFIFDSIPNDQETTKTNKQIEQDTFKAYVLLNQITITDRFLISKQIKEENNLSPTPAQALLEISFHNSDLINYRVDKLYECQFKRALLYFEFLSAQANCTTLLNAFYAHYEVTGYKDYLKRLFGIVYSVLMMDKESHVEIHLEEQESMAFIDKHIANVDELITEVDFLNVRSNPLYKFEEDKYRIISPLFTIEMMYNGLFFRLKAINEELANGDKVTNFYNLKTYQFSEQYVLSKLLKEIYGNRYVQKTGLELDGIIDGAPDYYMRNGKYIHVYESKDILITKESKQSLDYRDLENELRIKLFENEKGSPKAVRQLVETVRKILNSEAVYDANIPLARVHIFPVLVLHYRMFNAAGLNSVINSWFDEELAKLEALGLDVSRVHSLVIIDVETLMFNKDALVKRKITVQNAFLEYEKEYLRFNMANARPKPRSMVEANKLIEDSLIPFSFYLDNKIEKLGYKRSGKDLLEKASVLFDEENE